MMTAAARPTYDDVNLILKLYEMRREERLRQARQWFAGSFKVKSVADFAALCPPGSEPNASYRMLTTYWEMAASFITSGVLNQELFFETTREFLLGRERRRPAMTVHPDGEPAVDELFLCLVSNVSPWTYLGARAINPSPDASFDTGLDIFALGRIGALRMSRTFLQTIARQPNARGRGVHRWHDLPEATVTASRPLTWQLDGDRLGTATGLRVRSVPAALRVVL